MTAVLEILRTMVRGGLSLTAVLNVMLAYAGMSLVSPLAELTAILR